MSYGNWNARSPYEVQRQNGKALDFEKAKALYESIKPLKGKRKTLDVRPIGERDRAWERIVKVSDTEYYVSCSSYVYQDNQKLLGEKVESEKRAITFKQEGEVETIILHKSRWGWMSPSIYYFYDFNLPQGMSMQKHKGTTYVRVKKPEGDYAYNYYTADKGDLTFYRPKGGTYWTALHVYREVKHSLNRAKTKAIREELKDFIEYAKSIAPLVEPKYSWGAVVGNDWRAELKRTNPNEYPESWMNMIIKYAGRVQRYDYNTRTYTCSEKGVINAIYRDVYKIEKPFNVEVVELGQLSHDPYRGWV